MLGVRLDPGPTRGSLALLALAAAALGCDGGTIAVPCSDERCSAQCVASGDESGTCNAADECVCRPVIDLPSGHRESVTSGGQVHRESGRFQLDLTIGPTSPSAQGQAGSRTLELGIQPQGDPARGL